MAKMVYRLMARERTVEIEAKDDWGRVVKAKPKERGGRSSMELIIWGSQALGREKGGGDMILSSWPTVR